MTSQAQLFEKLRGNDQQFKSLTPDEQVLLAQALRPAGPRGTFTDQQRVLMTNWWLLIVAEPPGSPDPSISFPVLTINGVRVAPIHLLTDIRPGETYFFARSYLMSLVIAYMEPVPEPEEEYIEEEVGVNVGEP